MKYAILGGTFNPIHTGHAIMAEFVYSTGLFDGIILMPSGDPPHKDTEVIDSKHRMNMCELVANQCKYIDTLDLEIERQGMTYTIDTLKHLKETTDHTYAWIIGADTLMSLEKWKDFEDVFKLTEFVVVNRIDIDDQVVNLKIEELSKRYFGKFTKVSMPFIGISSTLIRERVKNHKSIHHLVDRSVDSYIEEHELYQIEDDLDDDLKKRLQKSLKQKMSDKRFEHTMGVKKVAMSLANQYGCDINKAALAAMLHDCAKHLKHDEIFDYCDEYHVQLTDNERLNPQVVHAKIGAVMAADKYQIHDQEILGAIRYHTTAKAHMTLLEQIIYVADYIEPNRSKAANLDRYRLLAYDSLDDVTYYILKDTVAHLDSKGIEEITTLTIEAFDYYEALYYKKHNHEKE